MEEETEAGEGNDLSKLRCEWVAELDRVLTQPTASPEILCCTRLTFHKSLALSVQEIRHPHPTLSL